MNSLGTLNSPVSGPKHFIVPYQRNPLIKGRTEFLELLRDKLDEELPADKFNHRIALHGLGGVGKTQCALEYVYANKERYQRIYWISAVDQASMLSGYQKIAKQVKLPGLQVASTQEKAEAVLLWLKRQPNWLIVIDNLDDIKVANSLLPENALGQHTLITTRNARTIGIPAEPLEVPLLVPEDSVALLSALSNIPVRPGSEEEKQAHKIATELGYLPLAIDLAAAYIREIVGSFSEYQRPYKRNHKQLHVWVPDGNRQYSNSIATAWSLSFDLIQKDENATYILGLFSALNPDKILIEFLIRGLTALINDSGNIVTDEHSCSRIGEILSHQMGPTDQSLSIHRLVQTVIRDKMSKGQLTFTYTAVVKLCLEGFPGTTTNESRPLCRKYENQVVEPLLRINTMHSKELADIKQIVGNFLKSDGKYSDSEALLRQALEIRVITSGEEHPDTLTTMHTLASIYWQQGKSAKAETLGEEVLEKTRRILGEEHPDMLTSMHNLASTYWQQGKSAKAATLQEEVLEKSRRILGEEHPDTLVTMHALASTYWQQGKSAKAATLDQEVLEKRKRILGEVHPDTLTTMHNLAMTYWQQRKSAKAATLQEEVLEKRKRILGEEHPDTLVTMHNLATTYWQQGESAKAETLQEEVLEKSRRILGEEHPDTLTTMHALTLTYWQQGESAKAETLQEEVLEKRRRILGEEHPDMLATMHNLASTYWQQGKSAKAETLEEEVLEKRKRILGEEHPGTLTAMHALASTYLQQGESAKAETLQEEVLEKRRRILGEEHPDMLTTMNTLATTYWQQGESAKAETLQEEVLEKR